MKVIFNALFQTPSAMEKVRNGLAQIEELNELGKDCYYEQVMLDTKRVETAHKSCSFKNHTTVIMYQGDEYILKIKPSDFFSIVDHIASDKLLCRINN